MRARIGMCLCAGMCPWGTEMCLWGRACAFGRIRRGSLLELVVCDRMVAIMRRHGPLECEVLVLPTDLYEEMQTHTYTRTHAKAHVYVCILLVHAHKAARPYACKAACKRAQTDGGHTHACTHTTYRRSGGHMDGCMSRRARRWVHGQTDTWVHGPMAHRRTDGRTDGWMDGWTDGRTDGQGGVGGRADRKVDRRTN